MSSVSSKNLTRVESSKVFEAIGDENIHGCKKAEAPFGISETTAYMLTKREEEFKEMKVNQKMGSIRMHKLRKSKLLPVNVRTWEWLRGAMKRGEPISGKLIKEKALSFAHDESVFNFSASNGWLAGFKRRYGVRITTSSSSSSRARANTNIESYLCEKEKDIARETSHAVTPKWRRLFPDDLLEIGLPKPEEENLECVLPNQAIYLLEPII